MINEFGKNLSVLIEADYTKQHDWLLFASIISFKTYLPDSKIKVNCNLKNIGAGKNIPDSSAFLWVKKLNCEISFNKIIKNDFTISPLVFALDYYKNLKIVDCKSEEFFTFVKIEKKCGKFDIEKDFECQFNKDILNFDSNLSERKIIKIFKKCNNIYNLII